MERRHRMVLNETMQAIESEEDKYGKLILIERLEKNLLGKASKEEFDWAIEYLEEHCAIYNPKEGYILKF